jgi:hypothetical protein
MVVQPGGVVMSMGRRAVIRSIAALALAIGACGTLSAGPPGYLVLRRVESPVNHQRPGKPDAAMYDARSSGYAYGFFGAAPRSHFSRNFGTNRNYTQWARW